MRIDKASRPSFLLPLEWMDSAPLPDIELNQT